MAEYRQQKNPMMHSDLQARYVSLPTDALEQYLVLVYAGLLGSVTMINCTVLALTRLVFEYKGRHVPLAYSLVTLLFIFLLEDNSQKLWFDSRKYKAVIAVSIA